MASPSALPPSTTATAPETLTFPARDALKLEPHLPPSSSPSHQQDEPNTPQQKGTTKTPFVTLTFATSLDSSLALAPGVRTVLSGPQSKAMTHYLRSRHAAICVGVGTAIADDPGLNCRLKAGVGVAESSLSSLSSQPRPVIIDPRARWDLREDAKVLQLVRAGRGLAPFILVSEALAGDLEDDGGRLVGRRSLLERHGGKFILVRSAVTAGDGDRKAVRFSWGDVLRAVGDEGLDSIMIEGGGQIINSLLAPPDNELIDSVIVTIAPTWLGQGGVVVSPPRREGRDGKPFGPVRLAGAEWLPLGEDVVLCGKIAR